MDLRAIIKKLNSSRHTLPPKNALQKIPKIPSKTIECIHHNNGHCRNGNNCTYIHKKIQSQCESNDQLIQQNPLSVNKKAFIYSFQDNIEIDDLLSECFRSS
jgi:hypothetical protein